MKKEEILKILALTPMQEGMLFHALHDQDSNPYFEQCRFRLRGDLDPARFEAAWNQVLARHDILRARFVHKSVAQPRQVILKTQKLEFLLEDLTPLSPEAREKTLRDHMEADWRRGFDLTRDGLMRMALFRLDADSFEVLHSFHHIILDGWSVGILHEEALALYAGLLTGQPPRLPAPVSFARYLEWLERVDQAASARFWKMRLTGYTGRVALPDCHPAPEAPFDPEERHYALPAERFTRLKQLAARCRVTLNTVIQTAWGTLLALHNHTRDVVFIATVSGRPPEIPNVERMVGLFINAVPVRVRGAATLPFKNLLRQVGDDGLASQEHHHHSLAEIQAATPLRDAPLDHILVFENYAAAELSHFALDDGRGGQLVVEGYKQSDHSNYPLTVQFVPGDSLGITMILNRAAIAPERVDRLVAELWAILEQVSADETIPFGAIALPGVPTLDAAPAASPETHAPPADPHAITLAIAATFTAEPLAPHIRWWGRAFGLPIEPRFAGYNQVFQELLDPRSLLSTHAGPALLLVRFEDWIRDLTGSGIDACRAHLDSYFDRLLGALNGRINPAPLWIGLLPRASAIPEMPEALPLIAGLHDRLRAWIAAHPTLKPLPLDETLAAREAIAEIFDPSQERIGHIPFTDAHLAAMGAAIARRVHALKAPPFKVIALDCDNTLWQGICGEGGSAGVVVTPGHAALQRFMLERLNEGFLLALNSKNNPEDVWEVFANHPEMVLKREHIVTERINWRPKSENLRAMARELNLGSDSFLFLDDSGVECAEMMRNAPEVLTLRLPEDPDDLPLFLSLIWAFDRHQVTAEDQKRAAMYMEEVKRRQHQEQTGSLEDFLKTLEIKVYLEPIRPEHLARVSQLTQRTNQFNLSTIRRSETEIAALLEQPAWSGWCVHVTDRFGDYGLVGVVLAERRAGCLHLDTFLLSCRVLGRGVERAILSALRHHGLEQGLDTLEATFRPSAKNAPVREFLSTDSLLHPLRESPEEIVFGAPLANLPETPTHATLFLAAPPPQAPAAPKAASAPTGQPAPASVAHPTTRATGRPVRTLDWDPGATPENRLKHQAHYLPLIHATGEKKQALPVDEPVRRERLTAPFAAPRGAEERAMAKLWEEILGTGNPGRHDSFFELGGHSLKAVRLVARIQKQFNVAVSLAEIFAHPTIAALTALIRRRAATNLDPIPLLPEQPDYPVSPAQLRLWILQQMESAAIAYNTTSWFDFRGHLDGEILADALDAVARRHETLRTTFVQGAEGEEPFVLPRQKIHPEPLTRLMRVDLSDRPDPEAAARALALEEARTPFDLATGPLYRIGLLRLAPERHLLLLNMHHIISDGWSLEILQNETITLYSARLAGQSAVLPPLPIHYKEFAAHQNTRLAGSEAEAARRYWLEKIDTTEPPLHLPTDFPRPPVQTFQGRIHIHDFAPEQRERLLQLGATHQATLFMVLTALVKGLIWRHAGVRDPRAVIVGTPVAGRDRPELEEQIGLYLNTLALHDTIDPAEGFSTLLGKVRTSVTEAFTHQFYPFDRLIEELNPERDLSRSPLFDIMVVMQDAMPERPQPDGLTISAYEVDAQISRFDLVFDLFERDDALRLAVTYNTDLFRPGRIERLVGQLNEMIRQVATHPEMPIGRVPILPEAERKLLDSFNQRTAPCPRTTLVALFAAQVAATPEAIAIVEECGTCIDYRMLDAWSDRIAAHLLAEGLAGEEIVPLLVDRCAAFYAGLLGIMKAGGAVLPIDVATPGARLDFMLQDCGARRLLVERSFESPPLPLLAVESSRNGEPVAVAPPPRAPNNLAYVIYTSGSTGQPKGVLVEHGGFVNMTLAQIRAFEVVAGDRVAQFASPSFDASLSEIFMALLSGAALVPVCLATIHDPARLLNHFQTTGVNVATLPPVYLHSLCAGGDPAAILALKTLITAGEPPILEDALRLAGRMNYFNAYGPTETSVCASMQRVFPDPARYPHGQIPIGPPLENLTIHLVDGSGELAPVGVPGEIRVAGIGVARGYLNRPELTAERFGIQDGQTVEKNYATGDLGRWLEDGSLELLGRGDDQVKIRGNRVEPGEVVHQLLQHPLVEEAAVLVERNGDGNAELVAFVTPATLAAESPRAWLEPRLPAYMIPNRWVTLEKLPLSINGKVDRQALRRLAREACRESGVITPPATPLERRIAGVWQRILGRERIGITEDFFTLGGDSIKAIQVVAALRDLGVETKDLFLYPSIAALARAIGTRAPTPTTDPASERPVTGVLPLTAIQAWFFQDYPIDHHHFNHGEYLFFDTPLDERALLASLTAVQRHHDMLRACFRVDDGRIVQTIQDVDLPVDFERIDLRGVDGVEARVDQLTKALQSGINLSSGPLFKTRLFRLDGEERLLFVIHHLIIDAVSWRFLLDDILRGYEQVVAGLAIVLPPKGGSFQRWAFGIDEYSRSAALLAELNHWRAVDELPTPPIPGFIEPDPTRGVEIVDENITLTVDQTEALLAVTRRAGVEFRMIDALLASLAYSLRELTQTTRTPIMLESHGREPLVAGLDISRTVGWFTSVFPFVPSCEAGTSPLDLCRNQREALAKIPHQGIGYGILRYLTPGVTLSQKPRISFNFLGEYRLDGGALAEKVRGDLAPHRASDRASALYDLMFNAIVEGGQLQIFVAHDIRAFPPATIRALLDPMRSFLLNLVQSTHAGLAPLS